jgi:hypothetical protein
MNTLQKPVLTIAFTLALFSCATNSAQKEQKQKSPAFKNESGVASGTYEWSGDKSALKSDSTRFISSSAAIENNKDTSRKFIRTAELRFQVKNLIKSSYAIEDITSRFGGFVAYTSLNSTIDSKTLIAVSRDSSLETIHFTSTNTLTLRVPNTRLDSVLKTIAPLIDYLDYRIIKADDATLQLLTNRFITRRMLNHKNRMTLAIASKGRKLNETTDAEENLLSKEEQADNASLANLGLTDQVKFSTINLAIYQRQEVNREMVTNDRNITPYQPVFSSQMTEALGTGWDALKTFILFLSRLWVLLVLGGIGGFLFKRHFRTKE